MRICFQHFVIQMPDREYYIMLSKKSLHANTISLIFIVLNEISFVVNGEGFYNKTIKIEVLDTIKRFLVSIIHLL